ncbi:hypothetical protein LGV61_07415 [Desulfurispirillum indicum]|uniref:DUF6933 domain-containing protein n=1 Tax=Desulfurispirillum indicum TaxID=936456 RepID=UPI001CFC4052|nr:hypothetical protein [Desulfurispirillum indicum]UCZ55560.1 hypothetical protein LGV61_07415 [Desulfurispirillum indicum]
MITLHATKKLFDKLPLKEQGVLSPTGRSKYLYELPVLHDNPLSGWHGNLVTFQRRNCVLLLHNGTRFPLLIPNLTKPDFAELNFHFVDVFMSTLLKCGAEARHLDAAQHLLRPLQTDSGTSRSELSTLTQVKFETECMLDHDGVNIADMTGYSISAWLAGLFRSVKEAGYIVPRDQMLALLDTIKTDQADSK